MSRFRIFRPLGTACLAGLLVTAVAASRPTPMSASETAYAWRFEAVSPLSTPGCIPNVDADGLKVDGTDRPVVSWRESGCSLQRSATYSGFRWARRDAHTFQWTVRDIVDETCVFLGCPGLSANPPALAVRPDGAPFFLFGRIGEFEWYYVARVNLEEHPDGAGPDTLDPLAHRQSGAST